MHGLINRSIQCFLRDTYGVATWDAVAREAGLGFAGFEAMLTYPTELTDRIIDAAALILHHTRPSVLEDLGTYLVSHQNLEALRRLLRFGGVNFADFLNSLEELPERGRLAVPDLDLPDLELRDHPGGKYTLRCRGNIEGVGHVMVGLLRAMADDYGALVVLDFLGSGGGAEVIDIHLLDQSFNEARPFALGQRAGA